MFFVSEKTYCDLSEEFINYSLQKIKESQFNIGNLSANDQDLIYQNFYNSYMKSLGSSWSRSEFDSKADNWTFFGNVNGGIALRHQNSGLWKINACYGNPRDILNAVHEMQYGIGTDPIWGAMTDDIAVMLEKATKRDGDKKFKRVPQTIAKHLVPYITKVFGGSVQANSDGTISAKAPNGQMITKVLIANKVYYSQLLDNATNYPDKLPIPKPVLTILINALKLFMKVW